MAGKDFHFEGNRVVFHRTEPRTPLPFQHNDGGRAAAGYQGETGDCVTRAIAIATERPYREVYDALNAGSLAHSITRGHLRSYRASSARAGVVRDVYDQMLARLGWRWMPTMAIGSGCTVHLRQGELPAGRLIVRLSRHLVAVIDGVVHDTSDPTRGGDRCVYGYWSAPSEAA